MKLVFAFDSFKGSLSAREACAIAARVTGDRASAMAIPVADGGEGTVDALTGALDGKRMERQASGPLPGTMVTASYGWCDAPRLAVIEMAAASGLPLLAEHERNPLLTTTRGTGELVADAAASNPDAILLGVGGSATVDGGTGAARALGWRFLDGNGRDVPEGGGSLITIRRIEPPARHELPPVEVLCDVTNPLTGPRGAARVFGPQKGATPHMVELLEEGLANLAACVKEQLGIDIASLPGGGAAGGLAAGAVAWMGAKLVPGIDRILDAVRFGDACRNADWVITGEGKLDSQSLHGKVVSGVVRHARAAHPSVRIAVLAGQVALTPDQAREAGIDYTDAITPFGMPFDEARRHAPDLLRDAVMRLAPLLGPR